MQKRLAEEIRVLNERAGGGSCTDHAAYKHLTGQVLAFKKAGAMLDEELHKYDKDD